MLFKNIYYFVGVEYVYGCSVYILLVICQCHNWNWYFGIGIDILRWNWNWNAVICIDIMQLTPSLFGRTGMFTPSVSDNRCKPRIAHGRVSDTKPRLAQDMTELL